MEDLWSARTGLSLLLTAVCRKSLPCKPCKTALNLFPLCPLFMFCYLLSSSRSHRVILGEYDRQSGAEPIQVITISKVRVSITSKPFFQDHFNKMTPYFSWIILLSTLFRSSVTHTTTPRTSTMTSPSWSCHPQCTSTPVWLLCAWRPPPLASPLEPNVSPLDGAGLVRPVSHQLLKAQPIVRSSCWFGLFYI